MGWRDLFGLEPRLAVGVANAGAPLNAPTPRHRFAIGSDFETWNALVHGTAVAGRVSRVDAARVPAVQRARNLICGTVGALPLHALNVRGDKVEHALLAQPEALSGLVRSVTLARTVEDLLYEGSSLWIVLQRTAQGFPAAVQRVDWSQWTQDETTGTIRVRPPEVQALGKEVDARDVILFTSPNDPLLVAGGPAIRNLLRLEATAAMYADSPEPSAYFSPVDGVDPEDDDEVTRFLAEWREARRTRATAYVPGSLVLNAVPRMTADELQLIAAREFAVTEVARLTGIDANWLSVNVTTRTYSNIQDERRAFIDFTLSPFLKAIEERLSLGDVTPRGQRVLFNLNAFLRANTTERYAAHATALSAGFLTLDEVRDLEDRPPLPTEENTGADV